jgi:hypothetical protein
VLWLAFAGYVAVEIVGACRHEPWFDELQAWNIARASATPAQVAANGRYCGHPPLWYLMLWVAARVTHSVAGLHAVQLVAATGVAALVLFGAPFRPLFRVLLLGGYYFLFEYGVLCRNYAAGVLLLFGLCIVQRRGPRVRPVLYYALLFGLANVHFLFLLLAVSLHVSVLWVEARRGTLQRNEVIRHAALGAGLTLIPFLFILPPRDSQMTPAFWLSLWAPDNFFSVLVAPLRALVPLPAWWRHQFWNTQALLELAGDHSGGRVVAVCASVALVGLIFRVLPRRGQARLFLALSFALCLATAVFFPLTSARYAGVLFIAFLAALWIADAPGSRLGNIVVTSLLLVQAVAGLFALQRDLRFPFAGSTMVPTLAAKIPHDGPIVADYTSLESVTAFLDRPVFSLQQAKTVWFSTYDRSLDPHRPYRDGLEQFFAATGAGEAFLFSPASLDDRRVFDGSFTDRFQATSLGSREGVIVPGNDLHLYRVSPRAPTFRGSDDLSPLRP